MKSPVECLEGGAKGMKDTRTLRPTTYTPDFTGDFWLIETKGFRTPDFNIKWKLLKHMLPDNYMFLCLPRNKNQVIQCINRVIELKNTMSQIDSPIVN